MMTEIRQTADGLSWEYVYPTYFIGQYFPIYQREDPKMAEYKYRKIEDWLKSEIRSGGFQPGERIPTESDLMKRFDMSRQTIRLAVTHLEDEGLVHRVQGSGTFVSDEMRTKEEEISSGGDKSVTMIMTELNSYIFPEIMNGASDVLSQNGYMLNIRFTDSSYDREYEILKEIMKRPPGGLIIEPLNFGLLSCNLEMYRKITEKIPSVMIHTQSDLFCPVLSLREKEGEKKMTEYLIHLGHRNIGMLLRTSEMTGQNRFLGYLDALRENGIRYEPDNIVWTMRNCIDDLFQPDGNRTLERMLKNVTAVLCHDDRAAFKLNAYLQAKGIRVPEDISVAGYDDSFFSTLSYQITTVTHPKYKYGQNAAYALLELIENGRVDMKKYETEPRLVLRETVAKPPFLRKEQ